MAHADATVVVCKPVHEVFEFLSDGLNNSLWRPSITDIRLAIGKSGMVGSRYRQGIKGPNGKRITADFEITNVKQNEEIAFQVVAGPAKPKGRISLVSVNDGTRVRYVLDLETHGWDKLRDSYYAKAMENEVHQLNNLKHYLEKH
jgi:uncharacterized protein YndB with AHSA1/START domain